MKSVPEKLLQARRELDAISQVQLLDDWQHDQSGWYIKLRIKVDMPSGEIPEFTDWYVVVDTIYPSGDIKIYPAFENSIAVTFPHQSDNARTSDNGLWRKGALCTEVIDGMFSSDELPDSYRLLFHLRRAISWLNAAAKGTLVQPGDPFEKPYFPTYSSQRFVFSEDEVSHMQWDDIDETYGIAHASVLKDEPGIFVVRTFNRCSGEVVHHVDWGTMPSSKEESNHILLWTKLSRVPVLNIWQAPYTLGQLFDVCKDDGVDLLDIIRKCASQIRDSKKHWMLLGFPIPRYVGDENALIFWQAFQLPAFPSKKNLPNGFREKGKSRWLYESSMLLKSSNKVEWIESENWNDSEITQRGKLADPLLRKKYAIIGCGCVGASIAEMLVRSGVRNMTVIDRDIVMAGNLSRHTLTLCDVGKRKAEAVKDHLNAINPHARVRAIDKAFGFDEKGEINIDFLPYDLIIDCTGEDSVLYTLSRGCYRKNAVFISCAVGLEAEHIYMNMQTMQSLDFTYFFDEIAEHMRAEQAKAETLNLPRDGIGCWHPTFPARSDAIWMAASLFVKAIEGYYNNERHLNTSLVYEKNREEYTYGYQLVRKSEHE